MLNKHLLTKVFLSWLVLMWLRARFTIVDQISNQLNQV